MQLLSNVYLSQHFRCLFVTVPWWGTQAQMHDTSHKPKVDGLNCFYLL